jgi:hypothetical protein
MSTADVKAVNDAIDTLVDNSTSSTTDDALINTLAKVQAIATSYFKILNEADPSTTKVSNYVDGNTVQTIFGGSADGLSPSLGYINEGTTAVDLNGIDRNTNPVAQDYLNIGVTGTFTDARTSLLNTLIAEKNFGQVDSVKEIQTLATIVDKVLTLAGGTGNLTATELSTDLGLTGVNTDNLSAVNTAISQASDDGVDSFAELQSLVSLTRISAYADATDALTNVPSQFDWSSIVNLQNDKAANVLAYNSVVYSASSSTFGGLNGLNSIVSAYNDILDAADGNSATSPDAALTLSDYGTVLGLTSTAYLALSTGTNSANVESLMKGANSRLNDASLDTVNELSDIALAASRVIQLANETGVATTQGTGQATGVNNSAGVTKNDLSLLGLDASKINNGSGNYDTYEMSNILAEIQNLSPSAASDLATLQIKINNWALS